MIKILFFCIILNRLFLTNIMEYLFFIKPVIIFQILLQKNHCCNLIKKYIKRYFI